MLCRFLFFGLLCFGQLCLAQHHSHYASQTSNTIKSLSDADLKGLEEGSGTPFGGMAKAAELNRFPGPKHVLDAKQELGLSSNQIKKIEAVYEQMHKQALSIGKKLINLEAKLDKQFASQSINAHQLQMYTKESANVYGLLRYTHLLAHLKTKAILTEDQIQKYQSIRGYDADPCKNIPKGHPPEMWRKHHSCPPLPGNK
ncbi:MAG: hypothetical protein HRU09_15520 [Oligoflexales bacterium]|nr:hypothetical protein [Oligoflexales bacterium]